MGSGEVKTRNLISGSWEEWWIRESDHRHSMLGVLENLALDDGNMKKDGVVDAAKLARRIHTCKRLVPSRAKRQGWDLRILNIAPDIGLD